MIRNAFLILILVTAPALAQAQEKASNPGAKKKLSVSTGIGFAADIYTQTGFNWQLDAQYRLADSVSIGGFMQVVPVGGGTLFNMAGDVRHHFLGSSKLTPYVGAGMGFSHIGGLVGTGFLFSFITGLEYDLDERVAVTSDMRFNLTSLTGDTFHFTWQMFGVRYRF